MRGRGKGGGGEGSEEKLEARRGWERKKENIYIYNITCIHTTYISVHTYACSIHKCLFIYVHI